MVTRRFQEPTADQLPAMPMRVTFGGQSVIHTHVPPGGRTLEVFVPGIKVTVEYTFLGRVVVNTEIHEVT